MISYDTAKIRDRHYREKFDAKWAEIQAVRRVNRFLAYATNQKLFEELKAIYEDNLKAYETHYENNLRRYDHARMELESRKGEMHAIRYRSAQKLVQGAGQKLQTDDYEVNAQAADILNDFYKHLEAATKEYADWENQLAKYRARLKEVMTKVWSEDFARLKAVYQDVKARLQGELLPRLPAAPEEGEIEVAMDKRKSDVDRLKKKLRRRPTLLAAVQSIENKYYARADFEALRADLLKQRNIRLAKQAGIVLGIFALAGLAGGYLPQWYEQSTDRRDWALAQEENTIQSYQDYLDSHPEGNFIMLADSALMEVKAGKLSGLADSKGNVFDYEGELKELLPQGQGVANFESGGIYEGEWEMGRRQGKGKWVMSDSSVYQGNWLEDVREGWGVINYADGRLYRGNWQADTFHGKGTLIYPDSSFYQGQWLQGRKNGAGTWQTPGGLKYEGEWKADQYHGKGKLITPEGLTYSGNWEEGQLNGEVSEQWPDGMLFTGTMKNGKKQGRGSVMWPSGGAFTVEWEADTISGRGTFVSRFRDEYTGLWKGRLDQITLYDGQGNVFKRGKLEGGIFMGD